MAAAEDSVLKYMADNPGASITEISDAIVAYGADLDTLADLTGVSRADARAAFAPTPAASESDDSFDIMEALGLVGNINSGLAGAASSVPVNQSPVITNTAPAGVGPNSPYALSATDNTANKASAGDLLNTAGSTYNTIGNLQDYNKVKDAVALGDASLTDLANAEGVFAGGLGSVVGAVSGQESTAESLVLNLLSSNPATAPFALAYRLFDAMDLFGGGGMEATQMTPEQRELSNAAAKVSQAINLLDTTSSGNFGNDVDTEGLAPEAYLLDAYDVVSALEDSDLEFFGDTKDKLLDSLVGAGVDSSTSSQGVKGKWYDPETGEVLPDFNPNTGEGMGTLFPTFYPDSVADPGGGGGGDTAASSEAGSTASSSTDSASESAVDLDTEHPLVYEGNNVFRNVFTGEIILKDVSGGMYTVGGRYSTGEPNPATERTDTVFTGTLTLPTILPLPDFDGTSTTSTTGSTATGTTGTGTTGTGTTGTGTTGTGTTGTGTTGTGTTGTGTTGTGTTNTGGTGGGLSTGTGTGDGAGTGSGTGTGDGAGDGDGTGDGAGDGTGDGAERGQELADIVGGGGSGGMRGVATEQAGVADIAMLYDPSLSLAENMARILGKDKKTDAVDSALMYGGGIVQPTDLNNEILRIIEGR
jgi:hypothetical protein